ncbi:hypothetical protein [Dokdonia sp.]|uniref:hypothetical protein n=1 Tax=Dokdonia sp. TaxID=2024995 RepID=UPI003267261F
MAPIKLEDNMKERLEERTIEPTMAAWDRISSKLDAEQGVKKSKRVLWMSIAASFVGGVLMAVLFFQNDMTDQGPTVVDTNEVNRESIFVNPEEIVTPQQELVEEKEEEVAIIEDEEIKEEKALLKTQEFTKSNINNTQKNSESIVGTLPEEKTKQESVQEIKPSVENAIVTSENIDKKDTPAIIIDEELNKVITQKVEEVIAQVENKESITDAEIEELLKNAQREIISKQIFNQKTNKVNANALLLDVEAEIAPVSFRNKIFEAVVEGFEKTRDAVVNRNN